MSRRTGLAGITFIVLLAILGIGTLVGWHAVSQPIPGLSSEEPSAKPSCNDGLARGDLVSTTDVTVSVFNAGRRSGLADQTLGQLTARGFTAGDVGNAPETVRDVKFVRVLAPRKNDPAAQLVALQFGPQTLVQPTDQDLGPGVDVIVGDRFVGLAKAPRKIKAQAAGSGC